MRGMFGGYVAGVQLLPSDHGTLYPGGVSDEQDDEDLEGRTLMTVPGAEEGVAREAEAILESSSEFSRIEPERKRFKDRGEVGRGGMGVVKRVFDQDLLRNAALKVLEPGADAYASRVRRFLGEARITGQLQHPHVVPVHDVGIKDGGLAFSMKLVEGRTLEAVVAERPDERLEPDRLAATLRAFVKVCEAVEYAHSKGVVHRDIKPENIMVGEFGQVYLMDWGVAMLLDEPRAELVQQPQVLVSNVPGDSITEVDGAVIGTPNYMPPEQAKGKVMALGPAADIFALGATLFHIVTGRAPYEGPPGYPVLVKAAVCRIPEPTEIAPDAPSGLVRILKKAMAKEPEDRFATAGELAREVRSFLEGAWHLPTTHFPAGRLIVGEGEEAFTAYIIVRGTCHVFREDEAGERVAIRELGPNDVFGEAAIFTDGLRTASVEAVTDVEAMVVTRERLAESVQLNTWVGAFVRALGDRFREADLRLRDA